MDVQFHFLYYVLEFRHAVAIFIYFFKLLNPNIVFLQPYFLFLVFFLLVKGSIPATVYVWRPEDNLVELLLFFQLYIDFGEENSGE